MQTFDVVVIADDSGSMNTEIASSAADPSAPATRWDELKETIAVVAELASVLDDDGIDVYFLNTQPLNNIHGLTAELQAAFAVPPEGYTPIASTLRTVLRDTHFSKPPEQRKRLLVLIATDGEPTTPDGKVDKEDLKNVLLYERGAPGEVYVSFLACTDDPNELEYLNEWDKRIGGLDVVHNYASELAEVRAVQGHSFPFSRGDWVCKMLLGVVDAEIDGLDERPLVVPHAPPPPVAHQPTHHEAHLRPAHVHSVVRRNSAVDDGECVLQ
ncbi:hypothetical protein HDU82_002638 [Entophlyctis luteolus]|nr:hypothetical protein HDU82_002638 [Entophlyctis luteolus]